MRRRKFFHVLGGVAAGSAFWPVSGSKSLAAGSSSALAAQAAASGFDHYTEDYAQFCATPANERVFYALRDGRIVADASEPPDRTFDVSGKVVMAGAIDIHSHIAGGKMNIARALLPGPYTLVLPNPARRFRWLSGIEPATTGGRARCPPRRGWPAFCRRPCAPIWE